MTSAIAHRLDSIKNNAGVRSREIAELLDTTPQTVSRWQQGRVDPQPTKLHQLLALDWLATQLAEFYEPADARLWLYSPHKLLAGRRPADLIAEGDSDSVLALIDQLRDGAYV
ncbi:MAG: helix-turn-helix domain-containing protein [Actinomycetota bacterium]|nr:helix-turn-helix domain-containing protein [Actinomycetota bacterium]